MALMGLCSDRNGYGLEEGYPMMWRLGRWLIIEILDSSVLRVRAYV